jgi:hypothetical protein
MYDTMIAALQELLGLVITPEQFTERIQTDFAAYLAEKNA